MDDCSFGSFIGQCIGSEVIHKATGEIVDESVLDTTYIDSLESIEQSGFKLPLRANENAKNKQILRKSHFARYIVQVGLTELIVTRALQQRPLSILFYMLHHMNKQNKFHVSQTVISEETGIDRAHVSRSIKSLLESQCIAKIDDASIPSVQAFMVDPELAYKGDGSSLKGKIALFNLLLRKEARKKSATRRSKKEG